MRKFLMVSWPFLSCFCLFVCVIIMIMPWDRPTTGISSEVDKSSDKSSVFVERGVSDNVSKDLGTGAVPAGVLTAADAANRTEARIKKYEEELLAMGLPANFTIEDREGLMTTMSLIQSTTLSRRFSLELSEKSRLACLTDNVTAYLESLGYKVDSVNGIISW